MIKPIATQRIPYGKRRYEAGEEIDVQSEKDADLLVKIGKAKWPDQPSTTDLPKAAMPKRDPLIAPEHQEAAPEAPAHPQTYNRRDMVAAPAGRAGTAKPSRSSRPAPRSKGKT